MHRILVGRRSVIGAVLAAVVGSILFGSSVTETRAVFANPVVQSIVSAGVNVTGGPFDSNQVLVPDDSAGPVSAAAAGGGAGGTASARIEDGVLSGALETDGAGVLAGTFGSLTDTFLITSTTLPGGASVDLQVEIDYSWTLFPNGVPEPCVGTSTSANAEAILVALTTVLAITDHTCNAVDFSTGLTAVLAAKVGQEFPIDLVLNLNGGSLTGGSTSAAGTARMYVTPLGDDVDYETASGNDYRRPPDEEPTIEEQIAALIETIVDLNLEAGIANALDAKIDSAMSALEDINAKNDGAAVNALSALISHVEAQRGKKLTDAEADELIDEVLAIIAAIQAGGGGS